MPILPQLEAIVEGTPARSLQDTLLELSKLAAAQPKHPLPLLASVIVSGFGRDDFTNAKAYLAQSEALLRGADPNDPEVSFSQALYDAITAQFEVISPGVPQDETAVSNSWYTHGRAKKKWADGLQRMATIAVSRRLGTSSLPDTLVAMFQTQDRTIEPNDPAYATGVSALDRLRNSGTTPNLAAYFLLYAHRRARKYPDVIRVGQDLEKKIPNSAMVKHEIGAACFFSFDDANTERYLKAAEALTPNEPSVHLSMANFYVRRGDLDLATKHADTVAALDPAGKFAEQRKYAVSQIIRKRVVDLLSKP